MVEKKASPQMVVESPILSGNTLFQTPNKPSHSLKRFGANTNNVSNLITSPITSTPLTIHRKSLPTRRRFQTEINDEILTDNDDEINNETESQDHRSSTIYLPSRQDSTIDNNETIVMNENDNHYNSNIHNYDHGHVHIQSNKPDRFIKNQIIDNIDNNNEHSNDSSHDFDIIKEDNNNENDSFQETRYSVSIPFSQEMNTSILSSTGDYTINANNILQQNEGYNDTTIFNASLSSGSNSLENNIDKIINCTTAWLKKKDNINEDKEKSKDDDDGFFNGNFSAIGNFTIVNSNETTILNNSRVNNNTIEINDSMSSIKLIEILNFYLIKCKSNIYLNNLTNKFLNLNSEDLNKKNEIENDLIKKEIEKLSFLNRESSSSKNKKNQNKNEDRDRDRDRDKDKDEDKKNGKEIEKGKETENSNEKGKQKEKQKIKQKLKQKEKEVDKEKEKKRKENIDENNSQNKSDHDNGNQNNHMKIIDNLNKKVLKYKIKYLNLKNIVINKDKEIVSLNNQLFSHQNLFGNNKISKPISKYPKSYRQSGNPPRGKFNILNATKTITPTQVQTPKEKREKKNRKENNNGNSNSNSNNDNENNSATDGVIVNDNKTDTNKKINQTNSKVDSNIVGTSVNKNNKNNKSNKSNKSNKNNKNSPNYSNFINKFPSNQFNNQTVLNNNFGSNNFLNNQIIKNSTRAKRRLVDISNPGKYKKPNIFNTTVTTATTNNSNNNNTSNTSNTSNTNNGNVTNSPNRTILMNTSTNTTIDCFSPNKSMRLRLNSHNSSSDNNNIAGGIQTRENSNTLDMLASQAVLTLSSTSENQSVRDGLSAQSAQNTNSGNPPRYHNFKSLLNSEESNGTCIIRSSRIININKNKYAKIKDINSTDTIDEEE
ncbi:uncharacterized protein ASCRUDRAFT_78960 [Ascoidea rubescens DSM 1968]|uniref:Uncharacterized protein n=1 Tax=Ascoidea rubescens DSM 1968 TaxID=1344418 RepID=A0A1D2VQV9_9ASCO|nr:hypothetical protein ASCRUDRAFT_78960 [Ascoidea rubescens DSM 1968]ODV64003.1 hypothetical protein ASCRUDRAFT_78960 [Ascoidea rubescens DSM 1968]